MRTVLSLKDKSSRLLLSNLFLKRYREASTFPFDVSSSTFEYLVDMCNAVLRTALNETDFESARNVMTFSILTTCIVSTSPIERDYLSARIALHDIFKSVRYWMYCFDIIQSGKAGIIGVVETGGDVLKLRREMCRMHVYDDTQIEILEKVNEDYKLDLDMESLLEETPEFRSSVCMKVDAAQQLKAKAQDNAGNVARIEKQKRRRESVRQKLMSNSSANVEFGKKAMLAELQLFGKESKRSAGRNDSVDVLLQYDSDGQLQDKEVRLIAPSSVKKRSTLNQQHDLAVGKEQTKTTLAAVQESDSAKNFSRSLLQNERLIWKIRVVIESTIPHVSLNNNSGSFFLTNYCIFFVSLDPQDVEDKGITAFFEIPLRTIEQIHRTGSGADFKVHIKTKDFRTISFSNRHLRTDPIDCFLLLCDQYAFSPLPTFENLSVTDEGDVQGLGEHELDNANSCFTFGHTDELIESTPEVGGNARTVFFQYECEEEYQRQGAIHHATETKWRLSYLNLKYQLCNTYPRLLIVPASITDKELSSVAAYRGKHRLPVVTYRHINGAALLRSSSPLPGILQRRSTDDEKYLKLAGVQYILDARPKTSALATHAKGAGFENMSNYSGIKLLFMDIENIHSVRNSMEKLIDMIYREKGDSNYYGNLEDTKWLRHIRAIIIGSKKSQIY